MKLLLEKSKAGRGGPASHSLGPYVLAAALGLGARGFAAEVKAPALRSQESSPAAAQLPAREVLREIDDPATGRRWLLERDPAHPGGPGRLVPAAGRLTIGRSALPQIVPARLAQSAVPSPFQPVIRAGDRLVVEQDTAVIEARLEAVALGPAREGATFQARLTIGGKVVRAVALAPGRASLAPETGGWR